MKAVLFLIVACLAALLIAGCAAIGTSETAQEGTEASTQPGTAQEEAAAESPAEQPNILFVLTDDLDFASIEKMPNLRYLLAEEGASFENAFVSQSLCCPSRATILTGRYAHNHQIKGNKLPDGGFEKFRDEGLEEGTIAARLQEEGYRTALFGKYFNEYPDEDDRAYVPPGWDEWYGKFDKQRAQNYELNENGEIISYGNETEDYYTDVLSEQATDFVRRATSDPEGSPFFAWVAPTAPHLPATPAERHEDAFADEEAPRLPSFDEEDVSDKPSWLQDAAQLTEEEEAEIDEIHQKRLESMLAVDEMVGSLVEELEAAGELDNTYLIFTSDNGWIGGEHRKKMGKDRPYEEASHVPLLVRGPGIPAGSTIEQLALNTDLAPTFAELAGVEFPADGRSLTPLLRGEDPAWRSAILLEGFVGKGERVYGAVRTESHKYVEYGNGEEELYDLEADPYEMESLHESADPSLLEDMKTKLDALRDCARDECRKAEDAP